MHITKSEYDENLKLLIELLGVNSYFPIASRVTDYSPYFKSEDELNECISKPDNMEIVVLNIIFLESLFERLEKEGKIEWLESAGTEYMIRTKRYDIYSRVLHFGNVVLYTVNRNTNVKANYTSILMAYAIQNKIEKYL